MKSIKCCVLFVGLSCVSILMNPSSSSADSDVNMSSWDGSGATVFSNLIGYDTTNNNIFAIPSIKRLLATKDFTANHCTDGTNNYFHAHYWDSSNGTSGAASFSATNQTYADRYWDGVFGIAGYNGIEAMYLDGDSVTKVDSAIFDKDCYCFALEYCCNGGSYKYALVDGTHAGYAMASMCTINTAGTVAAKDIIGYTGGDLPGAGAHFNAIASVSSGTPVDLIWKYQVSGVYQLTRTHNQYDTPAYKLESTGPDYSWGIIPAGAGNSASKTIYSPKNRK